MALVRLRISAGSSDHALLAYVIHNKTTGAGKIICLEDLS